MTHHIWTTCPHCGKVNDRQGHVGGLSVKHVPQDGDVALCIGCGNLGIYAFTARGNLRRPTAAEMVSLSEDEDVQKARRAWLIMAVATHPPRGRA